MESLFSRASAGKPLTPFERASLRFIDMIVIAFVMAALPIVYAALTTGTITSTDWGTTLNVACSAGLTAVAAAVLKYVRARKDPTTIATGAGAGTQTMYSGDTPPANPKNGDVWIGSVGGQPQNNAMVTVDGNKTPVQYFSSETAPVITLPPSATPTQIAAARQAVNSVIESNDGTLPLADFLKVLPPLQLSPQDAAALVTTLENPGDAPQKLKDAADRYLQFVAEQTVAGTPPAAPAAAPTPPVMSSAGEQAAQTVENPGPIVPDGVNNEAASAIVPNASGSSEADAPTVDSGTSPSPSVEHPESGETVSPAL